MRVKHGLQIVGTVALLLGAFLVLESSTSPKQRHLPEYAILLDFGSAGSRGYIWQTSYTPHFEVEMFPPLQHFYRTVKPGLSSHLPDVDAAMVDVLELVDQAVRVLDIKAPSSEVAIYGFATGGLRLMAEEAGDHLDDDDDLDCNDIIEEDDDSFSRIVATKSLLEIRDRILHVHPKLIAPKNSFRVISGLEEGVFGWVSLQDLLYHGYHTFPQDLPQQGLGNALAVSTSNYIFEPHQVGAIDFGGASTQITYWLAESTSIISSDFLPVPEVSGRSVKGKLYTHSYLGFGVYEIRYRSIDAIMENNPLSHPCLLTGSFGKHYVDKDLLIGGTSNFEECISLIRSLFHWGDCLDPPCSFNGVHMPPLDISSSVVAFDYATVIAGHFGFAGATLLSELETQIEEYCSMTWEEANLDLTENHQERIPLSEERFLWRCFEGAYMLVLFRDGYGFKDSAPNLIFTRELSFEKLSWARGSVIQSRFDATC